MNRTNNYSQTCHCLIVLLAIISMGVYSIANVAAKEALPSKSWNYKVRNNPNAANKSMMQWQVERTEELDKRQTVTGMAGSGALGAGAGGIAPGTGSTANYSVINVILDDGASGRVDIDTHQDSDGDQTATSLSTTGYNAPVNVKVEP